MPRQHQRQITSENTETMRAIIRAQTAMSALCVITKGDRPLDDVLERRVLGRECHAQFQRASFHLSIASHALDLALGSDANLF